MTAQTLSKITSRLPYVVGMTRSYCNIKYLVSRHMLIVYEKYASDNWHRYAGKASNNLLYFTNGNHQVHKNLVGVILSLKQFSILGQIQKKKKAQTCSQQCNYRAEIKSLLQTSNKAVYTTDED